MSAWSDYFGTKASPVAGAGGGDQFGNTSPGSQSSMGGVYKPTPAGGNASPGGDESDQTMGVVSINPLDPAATSLDPIGQLFDGLRQGLLGPGGSGPEAEARRSKSVLGGVPVLSPILGGAADLLGGAGEVVGGVAAGVGGSLERVPGLTGAGVALGPDGKLMTPEEALNAQYAMIPEDFRKEYDEAIEKEHGLFGTGLLDNDAHFKSLAVRHYAESEQYEKPSLTPGAFTAPGSMADSIANLFDSLGSSSAVVSKGWAQLDTPAQEGMDRIDLILAVGDEEAAFNEDKGILGTGVLAGDPTTGLNPLEELVYVNVKSGKWTRDQAADLLASNGQAFGHSALVNIGGAVALDPLNVGSFGATALAKAGAKGAQMVSKLAYAEQEFATIGKALQEAQQAVRVARVGGRGAENLSAARKALRAVQEQYDTAEVSFKSLSAFRSGGSIRGANVLARSAEGSEKLGAAFRFVGKGYGALEGSNLGRAAKVARTIIDPFHALDLHTPGSARILDLYTEAVPRNVIDTIGVHHYKGMLDDALRLDPTRGMYDQLASDLGVASANMAREGVVDMYRAGQIAAGLGEELMKTLPGDVFDTAVQATKQRDLEKWLRFNSLKHVLVDQWTPAAEKTLASQLEQAYHTPGPREGVTWMEAFRGMAKEQKSLYKLAAYGATNRALLNYVANVAPEIAAKFPAIPQRMVLLAHGTLTRVSGESILTQLTKAKSLKKRLAIIDAAQEKYQSLRYVSIDPANLEHSVDQFIENLKDGLDRLPMQLTDDEFAKLGDDAENLKSLLGEYKLGFRPEDRFLWGLERESGSGLYRPATSAWADHVADGDIAYRPASALRVNVVGHPLVDVPVVRAAVRAVDHIDSAARLMKTQVSSAMVFEAARKRFLAKAVENLSEHGVTERVAQDWFERITEYTREHPGYSGPRGMSGGELFTAIREKGLIPQPLLNGERVLNPDDIMRLVLEAYDGDMRYIGLTQKLSGRAKRMLFETTGSNWAGQIAEHAWPLLKFRYNPIFQLQEKIEPWVLNAQRGVSFATGVNMSEADRATERLLQSMTDNSLVRQSDLDQFEYSAAVLFGKTWNKTAAKSGTVLNRMKGVGDQIRDVQGVKRLNMLRTFRKGLGKELRAAWDQANPGAWDDMKNAADFRAGRILDEDDFALQLVSENAFASDVFVKNVLDKSGKFTGRSADWGNAIKTGAWHTPTTLGELKALDLDHVARALRLVSGKGEEIKDLNQLRQALATEPNVMDNIVDGLTRLGADKDYVRRVRNALDFSWGGFWKTAETRFGLTAEESFNLQAMMAQAAKLRDMTPVDFMSQVFSPSLIDGTEGVLGHLEGTVRVLRDARAAGRKIKPREAKLAETRTRLAGKEGVSTREDLVRQLSKTFSAHLDPSAKRALLLEFTPDIRQAVLDGKVRLDLDEVQSLWDDMAEGQLADRILGYMDGKVGSAGHDVVDDAARGVERVRDAATRYMQERGVTPHGERRYYQPDEDLSQRSARAYSELPETPFERTGRRPTIKQVQSASTELKPRPDGVDERTYAAYQDLVVETRSQWDYMTRPKAKGGLGLKVIIAKGDPYADSAAMRADVAKGQIRVFAGSSDHPLMTNEQNVMFRAVHDVFGHAAEGFEFGPRGELNAAIKHAQMYSDTSRAAMLTETHGQNSWVNFGDEPFVSDEPVRAFLDRADPAGSFEAAHPFSPNESTRVFLQENPDFPVDQATNTVTFAGKGPSGKRITVKYEYSKTIGDGFSVMPPEYQRAFLQPIHDLMQEFPGLQIKHIDVLSFNEPLDVLDVDTIAGMGYGSGASGLTWASDNGEAVIIFNKDQYPDANFTPEAFSRKVYEESKSAIGASYSEGVRQSSPGTPRTVVVHSPAYLARHEAGHAFDSARRPYGTRAAAGYEDYFAMMTRFEKLGSSLDLSEYGLTHTQEFGAELFALVTDPDYARYIERAPESVKDMAEEFRQYLLESGEWKPLKPGVDNALVLDTLPRPPFARERVFASAEPGQMVTSGEWGPGLYVSSDATAVGGKVSSYTVTSDDLLDLSGIGEGETIADYVKAAMDENFGQVPPNVQDLSDLTTSILRLPLDSTVEDIQRLIRKSPKAFHKALKDGKYAGFRTRTATVITDERALTAEGSDVLRRVAPEPVVETVAQVNRAKPGTVYAKQKAALLPQDILDEFGEKFVGRGKHVESNPDVARTAQMFGKWSEAVVANGLLRGEHGVYSDLLHDIAGLPTGAAVPYNFTEGAIVNLATQNMVRKWDDAFRLQYFAQERSFLERSLNHPMFGLYPASYMWGKIMPEMVRFLATTPFGNKTGGLLYSMMDVQASIALRREYDPYFDQNIEKLGHSQAMSFGGYLMPSIPWDISAAAPGWMRSIAQQGLSNAGKTVDKQKDISLVDPAVDVTKRLAPLLTTIPWAARAADEINPFGEGPTPQEEARDARDMNRAVKAAELQPTLQRIMEELQEALR